MPIHVKTDINTDSNGCHPTTSAGFTLIELVVVMALIGIMLFVAVPRFQDDYLSSKTKKVSRWLLINIPSCKLKAIREQKHVILRIDLDAHKMWIISEDMDEGAPESALKNAFQFPEGVVIKDVDFGDGDLITSGETEIVFYPAGYSYRAILHVEDNDDNQLSFIVEPFLTKTKMIEEYVNFGT
ncbi:MAG: prepilin-type N-terminal cleavage/methylation domain-containing protein [Desulfobacteraceae bacterium]|nr:prepilin-type N-terminal cleavage/methylation domain-containing protein [Desulfobacteraceae bacterium]